MNEELHAIYTQDQADRKGKNRINANVQEQDRIRRQRVQELLTAGSIQTADDYFHAAMVFQHGEQLDDYWKAHELARKAAELGHSTGRWLTAASYDRWLMRQGKPQKYGTQYTMPPGSSMFTLYEVDPTTTDEERAEWNVPSLADAHKRAAEINNR
jgi:hypothetical protein